jgi:hypothetical protein
VPEWRMMEDNWRKAGRAAPGKTADMGGSSEQAAASVRPTARFMRGLLLAILLAVPLWIAIFLLVRLLLARL